MKGKNYIYNEKKAKEFFFFFLKNKGKELLA